MPPSLMTLVLVISPCSTRHNWWLFSYTKRYDDSNCKHKRKIAFEGKCTQDVTLVLILLIMLLNICLSFSWNYKCVRNAIIILPTIDYKLMGGFIYILDSSNSSSFPFWQFFGHEQEKCSDKTIQQSHEKKDALLQVHS